MSSEKPPALSTPMAILIGSIIIAAALYFGLEKNPAPPAPPAEKATPAAPNPLVPTAKPTPTVDKAKVIRDATAALGKFKKSLSETCFAPALAKKPDPPNLKVLFNLTFNAAGKMIARGVIEDRTTSRTEVLTCISENFPEISIAPPGQTVLVDVPFELP